VRLALLSGQEHLSIAVERLAAGFETKGVEFASVVKLRRSQLQDAVPMTLGEEFHAFGVTLREDVLRPGEAAQLLHELNLGGTAVGTGITADPLYASMVIEKLALLTGP
jgi:aspartate ammonia-lyase